MRLRGGREKAHISPSTFLPNDFPPTIRTLIEEENTLHSVGGLLKSLESLFAVNDDETSPARPTGKCHASAIA